MIQKINLVRRIYQRIFSHRNSHNTNIIKLEFKPDTFEKSGNRIKNFNIMHIEYGNHKQRKLKVELNPKDKAVIYKKVLNKETGKTTKIPIEVFVAKSQNKYRTSYHFLDENVNEIGYVTIYDWSKAPSFEKADTIYSKNYPELGIVGDRITIDCLQNNNEQKYAGIGKAADQIAIEYCLKEGLTPNIVSLADTGSLIAHYKRGRRFFKVQEDDIFSDYEGLMAEYGTNDPNKIIETQLASLPKGSWIDCTDLGQLHMYMPQEIIQKYLNKIKEHPILH